MASLDAFIQHGHNNYALNNNNNNNNNNGTATLRM
jgi:hypothetical protein